MDITVEQLTFALIRAGFFFPSERDDARKAADDIFFIVTDNDPGYTDGVWNGTMEACALPSRPASLD